MPAHLAVMRDLLPRETYKYFEALFGLIGRSSLAAYLAWLTPRLHLIYESLSDQGSLYLHCDSNSSHYLKHVLDKIFGPANFQNEIIWRRTHAHSSAHRFGPVHDVILYYSKTSDRIWNPMYINYDSNYIDKYFTHHDDNGQYQTITCSAPGDRTGTRAHYEWRGNYLRLDDIGLGGESRWRNLNQVGALFTRLTAYRDLRGTSTMALVWLFKMFGATFNGWTLTRVNVLDTKRRSLSNCLNASSRQVLVLGTWSLIHSAVPELPLWQRNGSIAVGSALTPLSSLVLWPLVEREPMRVISP